MRISILHLDLGIGGAEKLIVSIALALKDTSVESKMLHDITIYTTHHDKSHCFEETLNDHQLGKCIKVYGDWLPRHLSFTSSTSNSGTALCAMIRMCYLGLIICIQQVLVLWNYLPDEYLSDVIIIDGVSTCIPMFTYMNIPTLFYCHYPDKLLCVSSERKGLKHYYRQVIDWVEEITTGCAHSILVNSKFTATQFKSAFQTLGKCISPSVLYPVVEFESEANIEYARAHQAELMPYLASADIHTHIFVSLNRYERKKSVSLALLALRDLREQLEVSSSSASNSNNNSNSNSDQSPLKLLLVVAGGYDVRVEENVQYLQELQRLAADCQFNILTSDDAAGSSLPTGLKLTGNTNSSTSGSRGRIQCDIVFRTSISLLERVALLLRATALLYTPHNEHFGIVPIEAMYLECPVIAVNAGGPMETVVDDKTGFLCEQTSAAFAEAMRRFIDPDPISADHQALQSLRLTLRQRLGKTGKSHVQKLFSPKALVKDINKYVHETHGYYRRPMKTDSCGTKANIERVNSHINSILLMFGIINPNT